MKIWPNIILDLFLVTFSISSSTGLNILVVLPCYGGHFGAMTTIVQLLSRDNHVTVISTSPVCEKKLAPVQKRASFELIKEDIIMGDADLESQLQFLMEIGPMWVQLAKNITTYLDVYLAENKENFDIIIADITNLGVFLSAETFDMPIIVSTPGTSISVEYADEKHEVGFFELIIYNYALGVFTSFIAESRRKRKLPELVSQNDLVPFEYYSRFPALIYTSPSFFPAPHKSVEHLFIGGYRNNTDLEPLSPELLEWIDYDSLDVIYVSMGTHIKLPRQKIQDFTEKVYQQNNFRVIWSLSVGMQKTVSELGLTSDRKMFFSKYLPQYTLLGHPKVKVFVTHGGLLSSVDAIKQKKPTVCVPQLGDQFYNCRRMRSWGTSKTISDFSFIEVNEAISKILSNYESFASNASKYEQDFSKHEDIETLNRFVEKIAARGKTTLIVEFEFQIASHRTVRGWLILKTVSFMFFVILLMLVFKVIMRFIRSDNGNKKAKTS